ncbi:hypothetical protein ACHAWU_003454 [Discostella pseudostelligera]|uniref:Uncharacterized protein n=1 Tax=Discostella pseudostelligera TaxID=259834 RepID=A0ABD3M2T1_9STRA
MAATAMVLGVYLIHLFLYTRRATMFSKQNQQWIDNPKTEEITANKSSLTTTASTTDRNCFPSRNDQINVDYHTTVYLEVAWFDLHSETFYSYINEICSCDKGKDLLWTVDAVPHFYIGPEGFLSSGLQEILREYNTSTCGPIFFGSPENPNLTIVTTSYKGNFIGNETTSQYRTLINDTRYIFICHDAYPSLEYAEKIYFLTPRHRRYIVPSYFPPSLVPSAPRSNSTIVKQPPIFLVLGSFHPNARKRNIQSLAYPLEKYRDYNFRIRFLGGAEAYAGATNEEQLQVLYDMFPHDTNKFEFFQRPDTDEFMKRVAESDVILPLIDRNLFSGTYDNGKKLTSAVSWGLGFHKMMILYRPLAEVFGLQEDNVTYFLHDDSINSDFTSFSDAFGRCLSVLNADNYY